MSVGLSQTTDKVGSRADKTTGGLPHCPAKVAAVRYRATADIIFALALALALDFSLLLGPCPRPLLGRALAPPSKVQELGLPSLFQVRLESGDHLSVLNQTRLGM